MSKHWKPYSDAGRISPTGERARKRWPEGATVGVVLVAAACLGLAAVLYHVAGPSDVFEEPSD